MGDWNGNTSIRRKGDNVKFLIAEEELVHVFFFFYCLDHDTFFYHLKKWKYS